MNEFERLEIKYWVRILGIYHETGKVYGYNKLDLGTIGFYIDNPDGISFDLTTLGIKVELNLSNFIKQCSGLLIKNEIDEIKKKMKPQGDEKKLKLASIFKDSNNAYSVCMELMEDLEITIDGNPNTSPGRVGKLTGLITAIKETPSMLKLDNPTDKLLLSYFNSHLKTSYSSFSKRNEDYESSKDDAKRYIKIHFKK